jgi:excisionase family DNA binding protein
MSDFYRVEEVARFLKVSIPSIYKWAREGKLPVYKFEKCVRVRADDLDEFCRQRRCAGARKVCVSTPEKRKRDKHRSGFRGKLETMTNRGKKEKRGIPT